MNIYFIFLTLKSFEASIGYDGPNILNCLNSYFAFLKKFIYFKKKIKILIKIIVSNF